MTIRFLDPPLHEFLPTKEEDIAEIAGELNITVDELKAVIASLHEFNPMMGHRAAAWPSPIRKLPKCRRPL